MTVVFDGDFLCYYTAHALQSKGDKLEHISFSNYVKSVFSTTNYINKKLLGGQAKRFIFCFDEGRSWRYAFLEKLGIEYKGAREEKKSRLPANFKSYRISFRKALVEHKFMVIGADGYEADDTIHFVVDMLDDAEVCIGSGDSDLTQKMISLENKEIFICNPHNKEYPLVRTAYQPQKVEKEEDFFESSTPMKFIDSAHGVRIDDPAHRLFVKVISGDTNDSIPSAFEYKTGESIKHVASTRAEGIHREISPIPTLEYIKALYESKEARVELASKVISYAKLKSLNDIDKYQQAIWRNAKCIMLNDIVYDDHNLNDIKLNISNQLKLPSTGTDLAKVLKGTAYDFNVNYYNY